MLECYLPLCYEFHAVPSIGTLHSTQVPWCNSSAKRMIFILGPWVTWYTSCVVHAHPKIAALDNSSKYTAGFVSSIDSIGWEYDWEQTFGVLSCDNLSFRPSVNHQVMFGSTNGNGKAKGINTSGSVKGSFVCLFCLVQYHSMEAWYERKLHIWDSNRRASQFWDFNRRWISFRALVMIK